MSLNDAYDLVQKGDRLVIKKQYKDASALYKEASELFRKQIDSTENDEVNSALQILVDQHSRRSKELSLMQNRKPPVKQQPVSQPKSIQQNISSKLKERPSTDNIAASLASARGIDNLVGDENADPISKFQTQVHNLIKINPPNQDPNIDVAAKIKPSGKSIEELELENATLKQLLANYSENLQVYESFHKKLKLYLRNYLATLKTDLQAQEKKEKVQYELKIEHLNKENKKLQSQTTKLKERWNELVESARKRREDSQDKKD